MKCLDCEKIAELEEDFYHCYNCDGLLCGKCVDIVNSSGEIFCLRCFNPPND